MAVPNLFIRCTHTGVLHGGRVNTNSVFVNDLDVGEEYQLRKVPCYVPRWMPVPPYAPNTPGYIDIPASSRSLLSFDTGVIRKFVNAGVLTASLWFQPEAYSNVTRPSSSLYPAGVSIWNTDDNALNWSDGAGHWRDAGGIIT